MIRIVNHHSNTKRNKVKNIFKIKTVSGSKFILIHFLSKIYKQKENVQEQKQTSNSFDM